MPYMLSHAPYDRRISHVVTAVSDDAGGVTSATLATIADVLMQNQVGESEEDTGEGKEDTGEGKEDTGEGKEDTGEGREVAGLVVLPSDACGEFARAQCSVYRIKRLSQPGLTAVDFKVRREAVCPSARPRPCPRANCAETLARGRQVSLAPQASVAELHKELAALAITQGVDIHMQREAVSRRIKRVVVFDMDSTLIRQECIDELARLAGQYDEVQVCAV